LFGPPDVRRVASMRTSCARPLHLAIAAGDRFSPAGTLACRGVYNSGVWAPAAVVFSMLGILSITEHAAVAAPPMRYLHHPPESALDRRYVYHWRILETALEKTRGTYGPYVMESSAFMTEKRQAFELANATGRLTVMYLGTTQELERTLIPIRIPVDKNLGGYCIFLIRKDRRQDFAGVRTLDDLRRFSYGLGLGWIDVDILRASGFTVVTGSNYDGLFEMLINRRFDVFLRAAVEVIDEYEARKTAMPDLQIEDSLIFYYPLPMYFWFSKTDEGRRLARRAEEGMRLMIADGTYDRIFAEFQGYKIERLHLKDRRIFKIENPLLSPATPFADKRLWFDPQTYRPPR
jgi:ABC-type amino acid transport substrate-binding protein